MFARFRSKKRNTYLRETSTPARRLGKSPNAKIYLYRRVVFGVAFLLTIAFIAKIVLSFFEAEHVSFELSGNAHYTEVQIYDVLAEQLDNIVTDSEERTADYLKQNLSYIKEARVSKHIMKRLLTIEITEREPFALLRFYQGLRTPPVSGTAADRESYLFLLDAEAHILESVASGEMGMPVDARFRERVVLIAAGNKYPKVGTAVETSGVLLAIQVLKAVLLQPQRLAAQIESIDASRPQQIKIQIEPLPLPIWIAEDAIASGLHHVSLLLEQHSVRILELLKARSPDAAQPYLDARFEDSLYLGGWTQYKAAASQKKGGEN